MEKHIVKVLKTEFVIHNIKRFEVEKPAGYAFVPGQATDVSVNKPGLEDELRPFTFTSTNDQDHLEFTIKIYKSHNGVTAKLADVNEGDELIIHEIFGAIHYKGPGLFLAGGAGITPFLAIFREQKLNGNLAGSTLFFANRNEKDVFLHDELKSLFGENYTDILSEPNPPEPSAFIEMRMLKEEVLKGTSLFYVCGPDKFIEIMVENLMSLGIRKSQIVIEE
ncbi:MAG TPA: FAD-binding oxidoreductase [Mucilaginibacter sp.]|jgi:ferredoxin-NADP reductase|nr:FAD-binding oxidoreductase [Mucilaginibacter sp.]